MATGKVKSLKSSYTTVSHNGQSGTLTLKRFGDIRILNFDDVKVGSTTLALSSALDSVDRPKTNANGCMFINGNQVVLIWIDTSGNMHTVAAAQGNTLNGCLSWTV